MNIRAKVERITPSTAKKWLEELNYEDNRNLNESKVAFLSRQITNGHWIINGATICFDIENRLIDGQHRLAACILAKKPIESIVAHGLTTQAYTTIDQGWKRSHAQIFTGKGEKYAVHLVGACRRIWFHQTSGQMIAARRPESSIDELELVMEYHGDEIRPLAEMIISSYCHKLAAGGLLIYCAWLFQQANDEKCIGFFTSLGDGVELRKGSPILCLRDRLQRTKADRVHFNDAQFFSFIARAWNAFYTGKTLSVLRVKQSDKEIVIPKIRGLK